MQLQSWPPPPSGSWGGQTCPQARSCRHLWTHAQPGHRCATVARVAGIGHADPCQRQLQASLLEPNSTTLVIVAGLPDAPADPAAAMPDVRRTLIRDQSPRSAEPTVRQAGREWRCAAVASSAVVLCWHTRGSPRPRSAAERAHDLAGSPPRRGSGDKACLPPPCAHNDASAVAESPRRPPDTHDRSRTRRGAVLDSGGTGRGSVADMTHAAGWQQ